MRKILFVIAAMAVMASCSKNSNNEVQQPNPDPDPDREGSIPVSTQILPRVGVIEEFTGVKCGYCPYGHKIVNDIMAQYPDQIYGINIHTGSYANYTYTTKEGDEYAAQWNVAYYPSGVVSRHDFMGDNKALNYDKFLIRAKQIIALKSPVNINAVASIDTATRQLAVQVRGYFTTEQTVASNSLYVMILQDSVMGSQSDYDNANPDQWIGDEYCHMHMFRTCINGTWGDEIIPAVCTHFNRQYTYTIPDKLGSTKPIDAVLHNLRILVIVAEGHKEILTACRPDVTLK